MQLLDALLPLFLFLIPSLSVHEAAHAWTADKLGDPTPRMLGRLTLNPLAHIDWIGTVLFPLLAAWSNFPLLGWAKPVPVNLRNLRHPRRDFALVALAGPVSNIILALLAAGVVRSMEAFGGVEFSYNTAGKLLRGFVDLNIWLAVFNMIPVPPLDGGNVLAGLAPEPIARLIDAVRPYGFIVLYVLMFTGYLGAIAAPIANAIYWTLL